MWYEGLSCISMVGINDLPSNKRLAKMKNCFAFQNQFANLLSTYAMNRYRLKEGTCPDTINERVFKEALLWYGSAVIFEKNGSPLVLPGRPTNAISFYGDSGYAWVWSRNGKFHEKVKLYIPNGDDSSIVRDTIEGTVSKNADGVLIRETELMYPFINYVVDYAQQLSNVRRKKDVALFQATRPYVIAANESAVKSVKAAMDSVKDNEEYIISTGIFNANDVQVFNLNLDSANTMSAMRDEYDWTLDQFKEMCGFNSNRATDKKANLLEAEVDVNNDSITNAVQSVVDTLNKYTAIANEKFGLNMEWEIGHKEEVEDNEVSQLSGDNDNVSDTVRRD